MRRCSSMLTVAIGLWAVLLTGVQAQSPAAPSQPPNLSKEPTLYVVPYSHLDTEWRWDYPTTIREYLPKTIRDNVALFEKYPTYVFNFSGANRYRMLAEYYPADYELVKRYVAAGRWFPSGSAMEESDVNSPSAESLIRQVLYGTQFFTREFGRTSAEYMLPDCFGFPASLPSILAHAGIKGFSTQKLSWNSANGIPFNVGVWEGLDGGSVIAALNAMSYSGDIRQDISRSPTPVPGAKSQPVDWPKRIQENGAKSGVFADYYYYGTGDTGGSPREPSVRLMEAILTRGTALVPPPGTARSGQPAETPREMRVGDGPVRVIQGTAERMFLDITPEQARGLPRYKGDLLLIEHSAGSLTSQAYLKRWNRRSEVLADAAERASVAAAWLGARPYPLARLNDAWTLVAGWQFHDIIPGTSIPKAYEYAWNDQAIAMNQFAGTLTSASDGVASAMDTRVRGTAVVVYNPLNITREDVVEATVSWPAGAPASVVVVGPDGQRVPAQVSAAGTVLFLAKVPSVGYAVFDVQAGDAATAAAPRNAPRKPAAPPLTVSETSLENGRYRVTLNANGDIGSLVDKAVDKELLSAPVRLAIKTDKPVDWPAWNMDWADQQKPPRAFVEGAASVRVVERGPVRVAVEVTRQAEGSTFVQTVRLAAGDAGQRVEIANVVSWKTPEANLKAVFPLSAANPQATYNWDIGTIQRGNNEARKFEVPSHQWFDLTDRSGTYGVTVLSNEKIASDKPDDQTLRLTLVRTPGIGTGNGRAYADQSTQDWGRHEFVYGLAGHAGDWRQGQTDWQAYRLDTPLLAFESPQHTGTLGRTFSLLTVSHPRIRVLAVKKAEQSDEVIVRAVELDGQPARGVRFGFAAPAVAAREVNGVEAPVGAATLAKGELVTDFGPYQVRSFAVRLGAPPAALAAPISQPVSLPFDQAVASPDRSVSVGAFDGTGRSLPAEMLPKEIWYHGVRFALGLPTTRNAVVPRGQVVALPPGTFTRLYLLAASYNGDQRATVRVGDTPTELTIHDWGGYLGQWDNRTWRAREEAVPATATQPARVRSTMEYAGLTPGFMKQAPLAWFASHRHQSDGSNDPYAFAYLHAYAIDVPAGATTLTLPTNERIRILAATLTNEARPIRPVQPLYDTLEVKR